MNSKRSNSFLVRKGESGVLFLEAALWLASIVIILSGIITVSSIVLRDIRIMESLRRSGLEISRLEAPPGSKLVDSDYFRCNTYGEIIIQELRRAKLDPNNFNISVELGESISDGYYPSQVITLSNKDTGKNPIQDAFSKKEYTVSLVTLAIGQPFSCKDIFDQGGVLN